MPNRAEVRPHARSLMTIWRTFAAPRGTTRKSTRSNSPIELTLARSALSCAMSSGPGFDFTCDRMISSETGEGLTISIEEISNGL